MEYLDNIGEKVGLGNVDLDNIKRQASFYLRDKFKSARLLLTDVTPSQLLAEEATNDDEWGPATKTMAAISDACRRPDESVRIMQVLHARLALIGKKYWRQFLKTLTVVEFLLFHGPEQVAMEFGSDRDLIEDLSRFNYVSERGVDHGLVVRNKAKQVLKLLMEDDYLKEERARAQKLSKSIFGQGSYQSSSISSGTSRYRGFGNTSTSSASTGLMLGDDADEYHTDKKFTAFEERILSEKRGSRQEKSKNGNGESTASEWRAFEDDAGAFSPKQNATDSNWANFSNASPESGPKLDVSSPFSRSNELLEGESFSPRSPQAPPPTTFGKSSAQSPLATTNVPVKSVKEEPNPRGKTKAKVRSYALSMSSSGDFKLPPPPPPPGGSKVTIIKSAKSQSAQPDLLDLSFDAPDSASDSQREESLFNFETPSKATRSNQAVLDFLDTTSSPISLPNTEFDFPNHNLSGDKVSETRSPGLSQLAPDLFDLSRNSTQNNSVDLGSLGHQVPANATSFVKDKGSEGGIPDFLNLNNESTTQSELDFFGTGVQPRSPAVSASTALPGGAPNLSVNGAHLEDQNFLSERSTTGAKEGVPDVFDTIAPDFGSFGIQGTERKPVANFQRESASGKTETAAEPAKVAESTPFEGQQQQVQELVHAQIKQMATVLDSILLKDPILEKPSPPAEKKRPSGLLFALGRQPEPEAPSRADVVETKPLNRDQVATAFGDLTGFTLHLKPSGIAHEEAGTGLFIKGKAGPGTVVSLYPGVIYSPSQYRYMPGYPKVDVDNGFLISRYDGLVVDGKPWGRGDDNREWWDGISFDVQVTSRERSPVPSFWHFVGGGKVISGPLEGAELERRSPLALGHFANHPPEGVQPNVMICPYTFCIASDQSMRAYIPNVMFGNDEELDMQRRGPLWINEGKKARPEEPDERRLSTVETSERPGSGFRAVLTLVLVATREVSDEELFLNYRLSSYIQQPSWYHPVNVAEEQRRWD